MKTKTEKKYVKTFDPNNAKDYKLFIKIFGGSGEPVKDVCGVLPLSDQDENGKRIRFQSDSEDVYTEFGWNCFTELKEAFLKGKTVQISNF